MFEKILRRVKTAVSLSDEETAVSKRLKRHSFLDVDMMSLSSLPFPFMHVPV